MRGLVFLARRARERHADRDVSSFAGRPDALAAVHDREPDADQDFRHPFLQPGVGLADGRYLESARELESLIGLLRLQVVDRSHCVLGTADTSLLASPFHHNMMP